MFNLEYTDYCTGEVYQAINDNGHYSILLPELNPNNEVVKNWHDIVALHTGLFEIDTMHSRIRVFRITEDGRVLYIHSHAKGYYLLPIGDNSGDCNSVLEIKI